MYVCMLAHICGGFISIFVAFYARMSGNLHYFQFFWMFQQYTPYFQNQADTIIGIKDSRYKALLSLHILNFPRILAACLLYVRMAHHSAVKFDTRGNSSTELIILPFSSTTEKEIVLLYLTPSVKIKLQPSLCQQFRFEIPILMIISWLRPTWWYISLYHQVDEMAYSLASIEDFYQKLWSESWTCLL